MLGEELIMKKIKPETEWSQTGWTVMQDAREEIIGMDRWGEIILSSLFVSNIFVAAMCFLLKIHILYMQN